VLKWERWNGRTTSERNNSSGFISYLSFVNLDTQLSRILKESTPLS